MNYLTMETVSIKVHPLSNRPTAAWKEISKNQKISVLDFKIPTEPVSPNKVRFVCMSDTHSYENRISFSIPDGDVFIHAGDFTKSGEKNEVVEFNTWLKSLPHKYKFVICGNHELTFNNQAENSPNQPSFLCGFPWGMSNSLYGAENFENRYGPGFAQGPWYDPPPVGNYGYTNGYNNVRTEDLRDYLTNCIYLEDSSFEVYGIKLYGTPWLPEYRRNGAFSLPRGKECLSKWNLIPNDIDILITHTPPLGYGDLVLSGVRAGCVELLSTVQQRVQPTYHIFGHIHESYGVFSDGQIIYINASTCDIMYEPRNLPIVFDVPLPAGQLKN